MVKPDRPDIPALLARWPGDPRTIAHVRDGANAVYRFAAGSAHRVLRLSDADHRSPEQLGAELDFVRFVASRDLTSRGLAVASPVASAAGAYIIRAGGAERLRRRLRR